MRSVLVERSWSIVWADADPAKQMTPASASRRSIVDSDLMPGRCTMAKPVCKVVGIDHISIRVKDYEKSKAFYGRLFEFLGFEISDEYPSTIGWTNGKTRFWIAPAEGSKKYRIGDV